MEESQLKKSDKIYENVLEFIQLHRNQFGVVPASIVVANETGIHHQQVEAAINRLKKEGYFEK